MDPFLIKLLALAAIVLFVGKRSIFGPQVNFARLSVALIFAGIAILQFATQREDFTANVGAVFMAIGMFVSLAMVSVDCVHMARTLFAKKST